MARASIIAAAISVALATSALARAQGTENKTAAEALFTEGRRLMDQGRFAEACKKLESSQKLDPGAGTLMNLAACYEKNGQSASAWVTYKDAASASAARHPDWAAQAMARVGELEPKLSKLTIDVTPTPGIVVTRDGITVDAAMYGVAIPVDPGPHTIDATSAGYKPFHADVTFGGSKEEKTIEIPMLAVGEARANGSRGSAQRVVGAVMMGVGGAGLLIGSIFGGVALGKKGEAGNPQNCTPDFKTCSPTGKGLVDDAKSAGNVSTVALIAGGAFAVGGLIVYLVAPKAFAAESQKVQARLGAEGAAVGLSIGGAF